MSRVGRRQLEGALARLGAAATTDSLTALVNRRGLAERAPILFSEAQRSGASVAVLSDATDLATLAERIRQNVEQGSDAVTISLGVATGRPQGGSSADEQLWNLIDTADALLYEAKQAGRNTVRIQGRPASMSLLVPPAAG